MMRQTRYGGAYHCRRCSCGASHTSRRPNEFVAPPTDSKGRFYWLECRGGGTVDAGDLKSSDVLAIMLVQVQPSAPTSLSSAVVNRLPLRAHKEKNVRPCRFPGEHPCFGLVGPAYSKALLGPVPARDAWALHSRPRPDEQLVLDGPHLRGAMPWIP